MDYSFSGGAVPQSQLESLCRLLKTSFDLDEVPEASCRLLVTGGGLLLGHCATVLRTVRLDSEERVLSLLGLVTVDGAHRGKGLGAELVSRMIDWQRKTGAAGLILNCGERLVPFYEKCGFVRVSECAVYERGGRLVEDEDPVMLILFSDPPEYCRYKQVYLGADF